MIRRETRSIAWMVFQSLRSLVSASCNAANCAWLRATLTVFRATFRVHWQPLRPEVATERCCTDPWLM